MLFDENIVRRVNRLMMSHKKKIIFKWSFLVLNQSLNRYTHTNVYRIRFQPIFNTVDSFIVFISGMKMGRDGWESRQQMDECVKYSWTFDTHRENIHRLNKQQSQNSIYRTSNDDYMHHSRFSAQTHCQTNGMNELWIRYHKSSSGYDFALFFRSLRYTSWFNMIIEMVFASCIHDLFSSTRLPSRISSSNYPHIIRVPLLQPRSLCFIT